jgi:hypothetical protein
VLASAASTYAVDSLVIPMDITFQDSGMLKAYGLVYKLLTNGVPVDWIIKPGKTYSQSDVTISFSDIRTLATGTHDYRGGPFVIDVVNRAAALPIIQAWQTANPSTTVHQATAAFTADVGRSLVAAPRMAVLADGDETIAFGYLNAAGIPDSQGNVWSSGSVDLLTPVAVAGPTTTNHSDGALFDVNGTPIFSLVMTMHYTYSAADTVQSEVVAEIGQFLTSRHLLFSECQSVEPTIENRAHFLTDQGLSMAVQPTSVDHFFADYPIAQADGAFTAVGGSEPAFLPVNIYLGTEGTEYWRIVRDHNSASDVLVAGYALQNTAAGRVVYLGGHQYTTTTPITTNPRSNAVRNFLNALLYAPETAIGDGLADLTATLSGPASPTANPDMDFSISYQNVGLGVALGAQLAVPIPSGMTASMVSGGGTISGGQIVWTLGNLDAGQPTPVGAFNFRLTAASAGTYTVTSTANYKRGITPVSVTSTVAVNFVPDLIFANGFE